MDLVEVDIVGLQALEAGITLLDNVAAAAASRVNVIIIHAPMNFGGQHNLCPFAITF